MFSARFINGRIVICGCTPHYRRPLVEIVQFRKEIAAQLREQNVALPITRKVHVTLRATRHLHGGDLSNLLQGPIQALDGGTLGIENAILADDKQICVLHAEWI